MALVGHVEDWGHHGEGDRYKTITFLIWLCNSLLGRIRGSGSFRAFCNDTPQETVNGAVADADLLGNPAHA